MAFLSNARPFNSKLTHSSSTCISMSKGFNNITVKNKEFVPERSHQVRGPLFRVHFRLSDQAPAEWGELFSIVWGQRVFYKMKRRTGVEGDFLWIECDPVELKDHHIDVLRSTVAWTNALYRKGIEEQKASGKNKEEWFWLDHVRVDDLAGGLDLGLA